MRRFHLPLIALGFLLLATTRLQAGTIIYHVPGDYPTIQSAVRAVPKYSSITYEIRIAPGRYQENVTISASRPNIILTGDGTRDPGEVTIYNGRGAGPLSINADDVTVRNLTLMNTAGTPVGDEEPLEGRALYTSGDRLMFNNVRFFGVQDTIFFETSSIGRCYFYDCYISGEVDFICGGGTAFFESCTICNVMKPGYITAPSTLPNLSYGFVFWNSTIIRDANVPDDSSYLMRPWGAYAASAFINTTMDYHIRTDGWAPWGGREETCRANELGSKYLDGTPVDMTQRASWVNAMFEPAEYFSDSAVLGDWHPWKRLNGVPFR